MEFYSGKLWVKFSENEVQFRVIGENDEPGVEEAMDKVEDLWLHLEQWDLQHSSYKRKWRGTKRVDSVLIPLAKK